MCDTLVAMSDVTVSGSVLFAKNSDRDPNEAQILEIVPGKEYTGTVDLKCTYITIPQVKKTHSVLLSKPFWIWGAEMGANEHGVTIGNEAVFTRIPHEKEPGLIGMDLLRLGLERGKTALEALQVITGLLAEYGQAGNCGFSHPFFYHNSFLIADQKDAWVLETAGRDWAAQKVKGIRSISNAITIGNDFDMVSENLVKQAVDRGWCRSENEFSFGKCYSDMIFTTFSAAKSRQICSTNLLSEKKEKISAVDMMKMLKSHKGDESADWSPDKAIAGADICMHAGFGPIRISQTTGSMVSEIGPNMQTHWVTGTSAPCLSIFNPVWIDSGLPDLGESPAGIVDATSLWWLHERLHREVIRDYPGRSLNIKTNLQTIQEEFIRSVENNLNGTLMERKEITRQCFNRVMNSYQEQYQIVKSMESKRTSRFYYESAWNELNKQAKLGQQG